FLRLVFLTEEVLDGVDLLLLFRLALLLGLLFSRRCLLLGLGGLRAEEVLDRVRRFARGGLFGLGLRRYGFGRPGFSRLGLRGPGLLRLGFRSRRLTGRG